MSEELDGLVERIRYIAEANSAKEFQLRKAHLAKHDLRAMLQALATPQPPSDAEAMREAAARVADEYAFQARCEAANGSPRDAELQTRYIANAIRALHLPAAPKLGREEIADIIAAKVSGPTFREETFVRAHRLDQLSAADAILAALAGEGR